MKMVDAAVELRNGAGGMARECWDPTMYVVAGPMQDGNRFLYLYDSTRRVAHEWFPHSIDARAKDWVILR